MSTTFSVFLGQGAMSYEALRERARVVETTGYDCLWLVDHMWPRGMPDVDFLEGWAAVTALAEATARVRLGVLVTCNSYRNPGMLAKTVATADHVSGGRIELGMGAGWMDEEYRAYGYEFPPIGVRLAQLGESLEIITSLFTRDRTTFEGRHYTFLDAPFAPKPVQKPLPITIGGGGPRVLMRLVAKYAQRWNCPMNTVPELAEHLCALRGHCDAIDRDHEEIIISEQIPIVIGRDDADYRAKRELAQMMIGGFVEDIDATAVCGTPSAVADRLAAKRAAGVDEFAILFGDLAMPDTLELFATRVIPELAA